MPLYDYLCPACGVALTLLLPLDATAPLCPTCRKADLAKQMAPCGAQIRGGPRSTGAPAPTPDTRSASPEPRAAGHVCGSGCRHGNASAPQACATDAHAAGLIKKYLG